MQDNPEQQIGRVPSEQREQEIPRLPATPFELSSNERDKPFLPILEQAKNDLEPVWRAVESPVMSAFETLTNGHWHSHMQKDGIPVRFTAVERSGSIPLRLGVRDKSPQATKEGRRNEVRTANSLLGSLVHELSHNFMDQSDYSFMKANFYPRIDVENFSTDNEKKEARKKLIIREAYAELIWKEVVDTVFPPEQVAEWLERRKAAYDGVFPFIDTLSEVDKQMIVDREYRKQHFAQKETQQKQKGLDGVRQKLRGFFTKPK